MEIKEIQDKVFSVVSIVTTEKDRKVDKNASIQEKDQLVNDLGLESLDLARIMTMLEFEIGFLPSSINLGAIHTVGDLVNMYLVQPPTERKSNIESVLDLKEEVKLDSFIRPSETILPFQRDEASAVLLTGANGFLGVYLLRDLLHGTIGDVYCLVRGKDEAHALSRLMDSIKDKELNFDNYSHRLKIVLGDLSAPMFGLDIYKYNELASKVSDVYHNAAWLNWLQPYNELKSANVNGTEEVLRFSATVRLKATHYISTVAVFFADFYAGKTVCESDTTSHYHGIELGYWQSKWVAERLVVEAAHRKMPVTIHRCPFIAGDSKTGVWKAEDFYCLLIRGCIELGFAPDWDHEFDISPVDYVSSSVVSISKWTQSNENVFHLNNLHPILWVELIDKINALGYSIELIPKMDWIVQLSEKIKNGGSILMPLWTLFRNGLSGDETMLDRLERKNIALMRCDKTVAKLEAETDIRCPEISKDLIETYISYLKRLGKL